MDFVKLLRENHIIGVAGNKNEAKTSLILEQLLTLKRNYPHLRVVVLGINTELYDILQSSGIQILLSKMDILDLQIRDTIIFVDEFAVLFDTSSRSKQLKKLRRFCDRIVHNNCKLIIGTTQEGFYNKFMCALISTFLVKKIEYDSLVNGTWLQERVKAITSISDYRLECDKKDFYIVSTKQSTEKHSFEYNTLLDTKKENKDLFGINPKKEN